MSLVKKVRKVASHRNGVCGNLRPEHQHLGEGWISTCERISAAHPDPDVRQLAELLLLLIIRREVTQDSNGTLAI